MTYYEPPPPALAIVIPLEGTPRLIPAAQTSGQMVRLVDWLGQHHADALEILAPGWLAAVATGAAT